jgi:hypothetical protein
LGKILASGVDATLRIVSFERTEVVQTVAADHNIDIFDGEVDDDDVQETNEDEDEELDEDNE